MRIRAEDKASPRHIEVLANDAMSPLFLAVIEATEEAVYNSLLRAMTITGHGHTVEAVPLEKTAEILRKCGAIKRETENGSDYAGSRSSSLFMQRCSVMPPLPWQSAGMPSPRG